MNIHEYQAKELLAKFGVPVPAGHAAMSVEEAVAAAERLPGPLWVVKSQIHAGGRGKGKFTEPGLLVLLGDAGLRVEEVHGVRIVADLVPGALVDGEPGAADALVALETATAQLPEFRAVATQLHVRATRS